MGSAPSAWHNVGFTEAVTAFFSQFRSCHKRSEWHIFTEPPGYIFKVLIICIWQGVSALTPVIVRNSRVWFIEICKQYPILSKSFCNLSPLNLSDILLGREGERKLTTLTLQVFTLSESPASKETNQMSKSTPRLQSTNGKSDPAHQVWQLINVNWKC